MSILPTNWFMVRLPPSCLMTHMFQICFTRILRHFTGSTSGQLFGDSHDFTRIIPAASSLSSSILDKLVMKNWGQNMWSPKTGGCHDKQHKNPKQNFQLTKSWPGCAAIWKEPFILPSGSFLLSHLSPRSPVCINHCGQQPSEFFLRSFKRWHPTGRMWISTSNTPSVTNRIERDTVGGDPKQPPAWHVTKTWVKR